MLTEKEKSEIEKLRASAEYKAYERRVKSMRGEKTFCAQCCREIGLTVQCVCARCGKVFCEDCIHEAGEYCEDCFEILESHFNPFRPFLGIEK